MPSLHNVYIFLGGAISAAVLEAMAPFINEMRSRLDTVKNELSRIEGKVEGMNEELQENKQQTSAELVGLNNIFNESIASLSEHIESQLAAVDARVMEEHREMESQLKYKLASELDDINLKLDLLSIHQDRLDAKVTLVNSEVEINILINVTEGLRTYSFGSPNTSPLNATINKGFSAIEHLLEEHIDQTTVLITELDSPSHEQLTKTLLSVNTSLTDHVSCIKKELNGLDDSVNTIIDELKNLTDDECVPGGYTCGGEGGWRRVVYLNMSDPTTSCPSGWQLISFPKRTCGKSNFNTLSCSPTFFPVNGGEYNRVCGSIIGYQDDFTDAFEAYDEFRVTTIDGAYVAGVSLTHGSPGSRQHIWTFAAGATEANPSINDVCPCDASISIDVPPFVGEDYFCESGNNFGSINGISADDPLWDGRNCTLGSTCCSFNNPPYFTKQLSNPTTDDIEARICLWESGEDTPIEFIELYVKGPNDGDGPCVSKTDVISSKLDSVSAVLREEHQETRDELEEHVNHVNSELVELQINQDNIDSKLDTLESQQDDLSTKVTSVSSELQQTKICLLSAIQNVCVEPGSGSGLPPLLDDCLSFTCDDCYTCGGEGGWRRAVYLDMTDPNTNCPPGWNETDYSKRTCGRASGGYYTCDSAYFPVSGGEYSQVCGKIRAYQWGTTLAFYGNSRPLIDEAYFSGLAVMHGSPREHIWTFMAGAFENANGASSVNQNALCPCDTSVNIITPPFVGNDYFCESGYVYPGSIADLEYVFHPDDPLWDGDGCSSTSTCCSLNNPPYFTKTLATPTTDDLELRLCFSFHSLYEDVAVELIELYVK